VLDILKMLERKVITGYCTTYTCPIWDVQFLKSFEGDLGRFAFRMQKYWGDLRKLMDLRMRETSNRNGPPLSHYEALRSMEFVAKGMRDLHNVGILHRDLKASNVFVEFTYKPGREHYICSSECKHVDLYNDAFDCRVGDFECSRGVVGTGFWRAPEILLGLKNRNVTPNLFTRKSDVYSYGMTCYEILTGKFPLEDVECSDYDFVLEGGRPKLPEFVDLWICEMLKSCWHSDPSKRPSFQDLCETLEHHIHK
jgi:serine/threonine protein kinase